jgi:hypothetical protein
MRLAPLKPLSESHFEAKIIAVAGHIAQRPLLILRDEGQLVGNAVFERQDLILIL